jgi:4-hydroxy-3-polyprenylbenzoate decarboxylase
VGEQRRRLVVGISGASGVIYGVRLLEVLRDHPEVETHLVMTNPGKLTITQETDLPIREVEALAHTLYDIRDIGASLASGSFRTAGMVIIPCSMKTASAVAHAYADDLLTRAADVTLKEGRPLVCVVRETPLHLGHLRTLVQLAEMGAVVLPPVPAFYNRPKTLDDLINHTVGRVLDRFGLSHSLVREWQGTRAATRERRAERTGKRQAAHGKSKAPSAVRRPPSASGAEEPA